jgi:hypothetical protein
MIKLRSASSLGRAPVHSTIEPIEGARLGGKKLAFAMKEAGNLLAAFRSTRTQVSRRTGA